MFRLTLTRFITTSSVTTYLPHAQRRYFQKSSFQSDENSVLSTIPIGNKNKESDRYLVSS